MDKIENQKEIDAHNAAYFIRVNGAKYVSDNGWYINWSQLAADTEEYIKKQ